MSQKLHWKGQKLHKIRCEICVCDGYKTRATHEPRALHLTRWRVAAAHSLHSIYLFLWQPLTYFQILLSHMLQDLCPCNVITHAFLTPCNNFILFHHFFLTFVYVWPTRVHFFLALTLYRYMYIILRGHEEKRDALAANSDILRWISRFTSSCVCWWCSPRSRSLSLLIVLMKARSLAHIFYMTGASANVLLLWYLFLIVWKLKITLFCFIWTILADDLDFDGIKHSIFTYPTLLKFYFWFTFAIIIQTQIS